MKQGVTYKCDLMPLIDQRQKDERVLLRKHWKSFCISNISFNSRCLVKMVTHTIVDLKKDMIEVLSAGDIYMLPYISKMLVRQRFICFLKQLLNQKRRHIDSGEDLINQVWIEAFFISLYDNSHLNTYKSLRGYLNACQYQKLTANF